MSYCTTLTDLCQHLFQLLSVVFLHQLNILNITDIWGVVKSLLKERMPPSCVGLKRRWATGPVEVHTRIHPKKYRVYRVVLSVGRCGGPMCQLSRVIKFLGVWRKSREVADTNPHSSMFIQTFSESIRISHDLPCFPKSSAYYPLLRILLISP